MSLRRAFLFIVGSFALLAFAAITSLLLATALLHRTANGIEDALEGVHHAEQLEIRLLGQNRTRDPAVRALIEGELEEGVRQSSGHVRNDEERRLLAEVSTRLDRYLRSWHPPDSEGAQFESLQGKTSAEFNQVFGAVRQLAQVNLEQSRALRDQADRWDRIANLGGTAMAGLIVLGLAGLVFWIRGSVFRPALELTDAIERYASGDKSARAPGTGPEEFRTIAQRFNDLAVALEQQRVGQLAFLAGVAHDLRNPLAALKLAGGAVSEGRPLPSEERVRQSFGRVQRQVERLDRMVNDFLDAARIEAGTLELKLEECDPLEVARAALDLFEPMAPGHQLVLKAPAEHLRLTADPARLEQVLINLVSNAIKYSPEGGVVSINVDREDAGVRLSVSDQGIGIAARELPLIYEPFGRTEGGRKSAPGVGLGLFVSRRIVEAHGGRLTVQTAPGQGSTFSVYLPGP